MLSITVREMSIKTAMRYQLTLLRIAILQKIYEDETRPRLRGTGTPTLWFSSVQFSRSVVSDSLQPHGLQHARPPCPPPAPGVYPNSCPVSQWCYLTISSSVVRFSSCPQSFPASGSFPMSQLFASGGQSIGASASASVPPMSIQDWFPLGWTGWISLLSKGLSSLLQHHCGWGCKWVGAATNENSMEFLRTVNTDLPPDLASPPFALDPEKIII